MFRLSFNQRWLHIAATVSLAAAAATSAWGSSSTLVIAVGATVRPYARIAVKSEPVGLRLTADDIERGYIDVPAPTILEVRTNSPRGYILRFDRVGDRLFLVVEDRELGVMLGSEGGRIVADHRGQAAHHVQLQWRFFLLEDVEPGVYPWPLLTSVAPRE